MAEVASAFVSLMPSARGFGSSAQRQIGPQMDGVAKTSGSRFGKVFAYSSMGPLRALGTAALGFFAVSKVKAFFGSAISEAREAQKVSALTAQVIKSTGGAAGISAKQVDQLSTAISRKTGIDDEQITSAQNLLLTFKNIKGEGGIYEGATRSLVDMAAAMAAASGGQVDFKSATTLVGKALNDPIKGLTALSRVGVTFTEGQKETIKKLVESGNTMKAQKLILRELNSEFGGAAASQATNADKARVAWGNLKEQIGGLLLPVIDKLAGVFSSKVVPAISTFISQMQSGEGAGGQFASIMRQIGDVLAQVFDFINNNRTVVATFVGVIVAWTVAQTALNIALAANPIGLIVIAVAALAAGFVYAYQNSETFRDVINGVFEFLKAAVTTVISFVTDHWKLIVVALTGPIGAAAILVIQHWTAIKNFVTNAVSTVINFVRDHWRLIITILGGPLGLAVALVTKHWNAIKAVTSAVWNAVKSVVSSNVNAIKSAINGIADLVGKVRGWFGDILSVIKTKLGQAVDFVKSVPGKMLDALAGFQQRFYDAGAKLVAMLGQGIRDKAQDAIDAVKDLAGKLAGMVPGSPVKEGPLKSFNGGGAGKKLMEMLAGGIKDASPKAVDAMRASLQKMADEVESRLDGVKSAFSSLRDSIASTFSGDLFNVSAIAASATDTLVTAAQSVSQAFFNNLHDTKTKLTDLLAAFKTLKGWGVPGAFLSQLFASGNSDLILELAGGTRGQANSAASLFGDVQSLSSQLGTQVARNQYGAQITRLDHKLQQIEANTRELRNLDKKLAGAINGAVSHGQRKGAA